MKKKKVMIEKIFGKSVNSLLVLCLFCFSCSSDGGEEEFPPATYSVSGKVEKGPFVSGSTITVQPMDERLQVMGEMYSTTINDDLGNFTLGSKEFQCPYAELMATGYFFNEVEGGLSNGTLTLRALVDLSDKQTVNVNVLTHLKYARIKNLVSSGSSFKAANMQAQEELLTFFGLGECVSQDASQFSIIAGTNESAALLAISSLLLVDRSEAALTEYLAKLSEEFGRTGTFSESIKSQMRKDKGKLVSRLANVKENVIDRYESLGIDVSVKDLVAFVDWDGNGIVGDEVMKDGESVTLECAEIAVPNEGGTYTVKIDSPIPVYLEMQLDEDVVVMEPEYGITEDYYFALYDKFDLSDFRDKEMSFTKSIEDGMLTIHVSPLASRKEKKASFSLYDYIGNVVATVTLVQEAGTVKIPIEDVPMLGQEGEMLVKDMASFISAGMQQYSVVEQYYAFNSVDDMVSGITADFGYISEAWNHFYGANNRLVQLRSMDEGMLNVYGDFFNVFSAMYYSTLLYGWGGVPYITEYAQLKNALSGIPRTSEQEMVADMQAKLLAAIENLEEKRNEPFDTTNSFFFVSKDVARILLANLYMYEGRYSEAAPLLAQVIENGFYQLDSSTDFKPSIDADTPYISVGSSTEVIFALLGEWQGTRAAVVTPGVMPYMTLSDVYLSLSECQYRMGREDDARFYLDKVIEAKGIAMMKGDLLWEIKQMREHLLLYSGTYFAFLKRNNLAKDACGVEDYRLLFPIPSSEMNNNMMMIQNPGY